MEEAVCRGSRGPPGRREGRWGGAEPRSSRPRGCRPHLGSEAEATREANQRSPPSRGGGRGSSPGAVLRERIGAGGQDPHAGRGAPGSRRGEGREEKARLPATEAEISPRGAGSRRSRPRTAEEEEEEVIVIEQQCRKKALKKPKPQQEKEKGQETQETEGFPEELFKRPEFFIFQPGTALAAEGQQGPWLGPEDAPRGRRRSPIRSGRARRRWPSGAGKQGEPADQLFPDSGKTPDSRESTRSARAGNTGPLCRPAETGVVGRAGRCIGRAVHGRRVSRPDQQLARRPASRSSAGASCWSGIAGRDAQGAAPHSAGGESDRQAAMATQWGRLERDSGTAETRRTGERKRISPGQGERPREEGRCKRRRSMEGPREGEGSSGRWGRQVSPEALEKEYESALACDGLGTSEGVGPPPCARRAGGTGGNLAGTLRAPALPGGRGLEKGEARDRQGCGTGDPNGEALNFPTLCAGDAKTSPGRRAACFEWADFESPAQLGLRLQAGGLAGALPHGLFELFECVKHTASSDAYFKRSGIFPLPVDFSSGGDSPHCPGATPEVKAWVNIVCLALNLLSGWKKKMPARRHGAQVKRVVETLRNRVERFLGLFEPRKVSPEDLWNDLKRKRISYDGEEFNEPVEVSVSQVLKSLPPLGHGGSVPLLPLLVGRARFLLEHPEEVVLPPELWDFGSTTARVHIKESEELAVWGLLAERGVVDWIDLDDVFRDDRGPVLSGLFGVPKPGKFTDSGDPLLRVIMNLKPINRVLDIIKGDIEELPMATTWAQLCLMEDETLHVSQADMSSAFYLFALPECWKRYLAFNAKFPGERLGRTAGRIYVPTCKVLPMGWSSSVGLMQMASRELVRRCAASGAAELRRQLRAPGWFVDAMLRGQGKQFWQVYLDNFMAAEVGKESAGGRGSEALHEAAVGSWTKHGVLCAEDKHVLGANSAIELGVNLDGTAGLIGAGPVRVHQLLAVTLVLLTQKNPKLKWVQIVLGRWIFALQFRRPAMAVLSQAWNYTKKGEDRRRWWPIVQRELALLVSMVPLIHSDLRMTFNETVTCSDASHFGGAVAVSLALSSAGMQLCQRIRSAHLEPKEAPLLLISAFNGIGGAPRSYDLAGVRPAGFISIECDRGARRTTRKAWPHVEEVNNILDIDLRMVQGWYNRYPRITRVHLIGGFPCVHLSSARADRENLAGEGSKLFYNLVKLIGWCRQVFEPTAIFDFVVENVRSMDTSARHEISRILGVEPLGLCPSDLLPYNRPRLAWTSAEIHATAGTTITRENDIWVVRMTGDGIPDEGWLEEGWNRCSTTPFSTL